MSKRKTYFPKLAIYFQMIVVSKPNCSGSCTGRHTGPPVSTALHGFLLLDDAVCNGDDAGGGADGGETVGNDESGRPLDRLSKARWILASVTESRARLPRPESKWADFFRKIRAMDTRGFWPPDRRAPRSPT